MIYMFAANIDACPAIAALGFMMMMMMNDDD